MSKFEVTTSQLRTTISDLTSDNEEFKRRVTELQEAQQELNSKWAGEANTAFNTAFNNDKSKWDKFATLVDQYIQALQSMTDGYERAEMANKEIATTRSF